MRNGVLIDHPVFFPLTGSFCEAERVQGLAAEFSIVGGGSGFFGKEFLVGRICRFYENRGSAFMRADANYQVESWVKHPPVGFNNAVPSLRHFQEPRVHFAFPLLHSRLRLRVSTSDDDECSRRWRMKSSVKHKT